MHCLSSLIFQRLAVLSLIVQRPNSLLLIQTSQQPPLPLINSLRHHMWEKGDCMVIPPMARNLVGLVRYQQGHGERHQAPAPLDCIERFGSVNTLLLK